MTEQQITEFDRWFEQRMDPELNLTPGDKELCQHAWQAALSHAEVEAVEPADTQILEIAQNPMVTPCLPWWLKDDVNAGDVQTAAIAFARAVLRKFGSYPAPQVAVPGGKRCACVFSEQGEPIQECLYHRYPAAHSAPQVAVPEGYALVPVDPNEEMLDAWFTAPRGDSGSVQDFATAYRAMLAAAPTAPAGELVTRCTAGLGCDEKGYCDAAATGQGDLCDRRTMAHEQPVSDPDGLHDNLRMAAQDAAEVLAESAKLHRRRGLSSPADACDRCAALLRDLLSSPAPDEREIAAKALSKFADQMGARHSDAENGQFFIDCAEEAYEEAARLRKLGGGHD